MLFPEPVGATERTSRPASIAATTSPCPGRKPSRPKTPRSTCSALAIIQGSLTVMWAPSQGGLTTARALHKSPAGPWHLLKRRHLEGAALALVPYLGREDLLPGRVARVPEEQVGEERRVKERNGAVVIRSQALIVTVEEVAASVAWSIDPPVSHVAHDPGIDPR